MLHECIISRFDIKLLIIICMHGFKYLMSCKPVCNSKSGSDPALLGLIGEKTDAQVSFAYKKSILGRNEKKKKKARYNAFPTTTRIRLLIALYVNMPMQGSV